MQHPPIIPDINPREMEGGGERERERSALSDASDKPYEGQGSLSISPPSRVSAPFAEAGSRGR